MQVLKKIINSIGVELVLIPKGTFLMGSPTEEEEASTKEEQHQVTISKDYFLGVYEVTQGQYEKLMGTNPSYFDSRELIGFDTSMHPVEQISRENVVEFCKRLSEMPEEKEEGRVYRLPTEAEWEYACRAGTTTAFSFGESSKSLDEFAWYIENSNGQTHPVGEKRPNAWGLYDMHGNILEWCSDWYGEYPKGPVTDPVGLKEGSYPVFRGGSFCHEASGCRSASRFPVPKSFLSAGACGFRLAMTPLGTPE
jgi:formylglycine-generating enzyme required for sulfatase activity